MSANRLFQLVCLLLERGRMTADQLADCLEVSTSTVYRDVDVLSAAGVPVFTAQGKGGGVDLMEGYVLDRTSFTQEEQRQLLDALQALPHSDPDDVLAKLSALFQRREQEWLQVHFTRWGGSGQDMDTFRLLRQAVLRRQAVRFVYASSQGDTLPHLVLPARLVYRGQSWYLQAYCPDRECYRDYRLTRMLSLEVTGQQFHRHLDPPDPKLAEEIPPLFRVEALLRFDPALTHRVYDEFDRSCITPQEDGSLEVRAVFPDDARLCGYLLSFGPGLRVLSPASLGAKLAQMGREIAQNNEAEV